MKDSSKIKAFPSFQLIQQLVVSLDNMKDCPPEDIKFWGENLKASIDTKIESILKEKEKNKDELQKVVDDALASFLGKR
jgi:hypothetical protein